MRIKVIKSQPNGQGQEAIDRLIGRTFKVIEEMANGEVAVNSRLFHGRIHLNKEEYKVIRKRRA